MNDVNYPIYVRQVMKPKCVFAEHTYPAYIDSFVTAKKRHCSRSVTLSDSINKFLVGPKKLSLQLSCVTVTGVTVSGRA